MHFVTTSRNNQIPWNFSTDVRPEFFYKFQTSVSGESCGYASRWVQTRSSREVPSHADSAWKKSQSMHSHIIWSTSAYYKTLLSWTTTIHIKQLPNGSEMNGENPVVSTCLVSCPARTPLPARSGLMSKSKFLSLVRTNLLVIIK